MPQINESGLKIFSIDDLQNAAEKSVQFSKLVKIGLYTHKSITIAPANESTARDIDVGVEFSLGI
jgi:succinyl-CoA synthetase beta subunit